MATETLDQIIAQFGVAIGTSVVPYLPAIKTFTMDELLAFANLLQQKSLDAAIKQVHDRMTPDELASEATQLAALTAQMTDNDYAKRQVASNIAMAILKVGLAIVLGFFGL